MKQTTQYTFAYHSSTLEDTEKLGKHTSASCTAPCVLHLQGELGAGKTTFVRAYLRGIGFSGRVKSPTYTLIEPYELGDYTLYHVDLYRLKQPGDMLTLALDDALSLDSICIIEWPDKGGKYVPAADVVCQIDYCNHESEHARAFHFIAYTPLGKRLLESLEKLTGETH